jgi:predicted Rossmann-fold nucleotide-binding protein
MATESMEISIQSRPEIASARSLVIAAGGGRDLAWPHQRIAAELLARSSGRLVHLLLHGGARGADAAIARAAHQLGWCSLVMPAQWQQHGRAAGPIRNRELLQQAIARAVAHSSPGLMASVLVVAFPGGAGTASLVLQARRLAFLSPVPIAVVEVSPSAGLWAVPSSELPPGA